MSSISTVMLPHKILGCGTLWWGKRLFTSSDHKSEASDTQVLICAAKRSGWYFRNTVPKMAGTDPRWLKPCENGSLHPFIPCLFSSFLFRRLRIPTVHLLECKSASVRPSVRSSCIYAWTVPEPLERFFLWNLVFMLSAAVYRRLPLPFRIGPQ